jgi:hypothetical protein
MREPRCLTILWASTACYRDSFTSFLPFLKHYVITPDQKICYQSQSGMGTAILLWVLLTVWSWSKLLIYRSSLRLAVVSVILLYLTHGMSISSFIYVIWCFERSHVTCTSVHYADMRSGYARKVMREIGHIFQYVPVVHRENIQIA